MTTTQPPPPDRLPARREPPLLLALRYGAVALLGAVAVLILIGATAVFADVDRLAAEKQAFGFWLGCLLVVLVAIAGLLLWHGGPARRWLVLAGGTLLVAGLSVLTTLLLEPAHTAHRSEDTWTQALVLVGLALLQAGLGYPLSRWRRRGEEQSSA